ncbi:MAG TPA: rod shape-determining protein MreD, partial [Streptosporangiaceae bacterium]|nr:rod shape-determining protein MreD [Streptosporangiaceae bacterium]
MRRILMSAVLLATAVVLQLTTINGLGLPGGGVPDLVLVVVAALGLASGPASGAIAGFAAGLALDLAPPASGLIGEYALVFVLVGWACGRLHATLARSAVLPIVIVAAAAALAELMVAGLSLALQSAQVSWAAVRQVLPASVSYDIAISPFVLYLVLVAGAWLADAARGRPAMSAAGRALAAGQAGSAARRGSGPGRWGLASPGALAAGQAGLVGPGSS